MTDPHTATDPTADTPRVTDLPPRAASWAATEAGRLAASPGPLTAMVIHPDGTMVITRLHVDDDAILSIVLRQAEPMFTRFYSRSSIPGFVVISSTAALEPNDPGRDFVRKHAQPGMGSEFLFGPLVFVGAEPTIDGIPVTYGFPDRPPMDDVPRALVLDYLGAEFDIDHHG